MTDLANLEQRLNALEKTQSGRARGSMPLALVAATLCALALACWLLAMLVQLEAERRSSTQQQNFWLLCQPGATAETRVAAFLALVKAGNEEWKSARLRRLPLAEVDLDSAHLNEATFDSANLSGASFVGAKLINANLPTADLSHATLDKAQLDGADLLKANLEDASLQKILARGVSLQQVTATGANFHLADMSDADLRMANLTNADLTATNLAGADLTSAVLKGATLSYTNFSNAVLGNVDFANSNWWKSRGLTADQLDYLASKFAPGDESDADLHLDFQVWQETRANRLD